MTMLGLHQLAAALYLAASLAAVLGLALAAPRMTRASVALLGVGALTHSASFVALHGVSAPPPLTSLPAVLSVTSWLAVVFFLALLLARSRLAGLAILIAPSAFLGVFASSLGLDASGEPAGAPSSSWSHVHILLSSAGLALLGISGIAGVLFVAEHSRIKAKRPVLFSLPLPTLEALDRVNRLSLGAGFLLLSLGLVTGILWVHAESGELWPGTAHANWTLVAWAIYSALAAARFGAGQAARDSALWAAVGFGFLLFAVVGVGVLS